MKRNRYDCDHDGPFGANMLRDQIEIGSVVIMVVFVVLKCYEINLESVPL